MTEDQTGKINKICGIAYDDLTKLKDQLDKIIEVKKKISSDAGGDSEKTKDIMKTMDSLAEINLKLPGVVEEIKGICQQMHLLLGHKSVGHLVAGRMSLLGGPKNK